MKPIEFIRPIATRLIGASFDPQELAAVMMHDGGLDMTPLKNEDLLKLMKGEFDCDWDRIFFSFSELLSYYANLKLNNYQIIAWCFAVFIIGEGARRDSTEWELYLDAMTKAFIRVSKVLTYEEFVSLLTIAFNQSRTE